MNNTQIDELRFDGQVAIITGARQGIGRAYAELMASRGVKLVLNSRGSLDELAEQLLKIPGAEVATLCGDAGDPDVNSKLVDLAIERFGRLDIVISNAGGGAIKPITESADIFQEVLQLDTVGPFHLVRNAWPHFVKQGYGRVLLTASTVGAYGIAGMVHYATAKGAIIGMTRALALEGAPLGIKVNVVAPNASTVGADSGVGVDFTDPWRKACTPAAVAPAAVVLTHEQCPVNGELINVGGGRVARMFMGNPPGFHDAALTPESLMAGWSTVMSEDGYCIPADAMESGNVWARKCAGY